MDKLQESNLEGTGAACPYVLKDEPSGKTTWMGKELLKEPRESKRMYHLWKEGQATQDVARSCRKKTREAKAQLEPNFATSVKDNNKYFYKYINGKRRGEDNLHSLLGMGGSIGPVTPPHS